MPRFFFTLLSLIFFVACPGTEPGIPDPNNPYPGGCVPGEECTPTEGVLLGDFEPNPTASWFPQGGCAWGSGVDIVATPVFSGASAVQISRGGCSIISSRVAMPPVSGGSSRALTFSARTWRATSGCGSSSCLDVEVRLYDAEGRRLESLYFAAGGPRAEEWFPFSETQTVGSAARTYAVVLRTFFGTGNDRVTVDGVTVGVVAK